LAPEGRFREERYVQAVPTPNRMGIAENQPNNQRLSAISVSIFRVVVGAICGVGILVCILEFNGLISGN
jgi:hypothetical protein